MINGHYTVEELRNDRGLWTRAKDEALRALGTNERDSGALLLMGRLMDAITQPACARAYYTRAVAADPKKIAALGACAASYLAGSDSRHAEMLFRKALEIEPGNPHMLNGLGVTLIKQGKPGEARGCFLDALNADAYQCHSYYYLADLYLKEGNLQEAEKALQTGMFQAFRTSDMDMIENLRKVEERLRELQAAIPQPGY